MVTTHRNGGMGGGLFLVFQELTLNNIGLSSFGYDFQANPDALNAYEALQTMPNKVLLACSMCIPGFSRLPFPCFRRRNHARTTLLRIMQDIITTKLSEHKAAGAPRDLLDLMLDADTCSHDALVHTMTLIFAGHDTTTAALCWTFFRLASQPSMAALARNECLAMLKRHGSFENGEALQGLSFTTACIQETLRLHPPVPFLGRRIAAQDMDVPMTDGSSIFVPKGTSVCVLHAAMHRDPTYWSQPEAFVPERFIPGMAPFEIDLGLRQGRSHALHYMPFSIGAKNCIGQRFAMAELQVVVATLLSRYEFAITADADFSNTFNGVSVQPAHLELSVVSV
ncbi:hypothetical protein DYB37_005711 [Aphanomyces astaci]|uniref:Cytochrome P450 n=1 Tax=Aphanomyces astaci TaxID=112090 RepID=A0A3R6X2J8_APHAT|nr:hypothetical protein DYB35_005765 [Aphanomyces astaci]RHZ33633.1 hypothetical protein DYB37_005711 [Aphanomyces astaci]